MIESTQDCTHMQPKETACWFVPNGRERLTAILMPFFGSPNGNILRSIDSKSRGYIIKPSPKFGIQAVTHHLHFLLYQYLVLI